MECRQVSRGRDEGMVTVATRPCEGNSNYRRGEGLTVVRLSKRWDVGLLVDIHTLSSR